MNACDRFQDLLADAVYGDLDAEDRQRLDAHFAECPDCSATARELSETVALLRREAPPRASSARLEGLWEQLEPRLDGSAQETAGKILPFPRRVWLPLAAAAALVLAILGVTLQRPGTPAPEVAPALIAASPEAAPGTALDEDLGRYYARATPLLLALSNRDPSRPAVSAGAERQAARRLAAEAERLRGDLEAADRRREHGLVADLEVVFLQLANLRTSEYAQGIELLQATLDHRAILFQLSVEELRRDAVSIRETAALNTAIA